MKRDGLICSLIAAYACFAMGIVFHVLKTPTPKTYAQVPMSLGVQDVRFTATADTPDPNEVFELVNKERVAVGSSALTANAKLAEVAAKRAADMAERQYYAHKNPDGQYYYDLFPAAGITAARSCENLDITFVPDVSMFIDEWSASLRGHRSCMIRKDLTQAGYAVTKMMLVEYGGKEVPAYLVVAIHSTDLQ